MTVLIHMSSVSGNWYKRTRLGEEISKQCIYVLFYISFYSFTWEWLNKSCRENKLKCLHSDHKSIWFLQAESRLLCYCHTLEAELCIHLFPSHGLLREEGELRQEQWKISLRSPEDPGKSSYNCQWSDMWWTSLPWLCVSYHWSLTLSPFSTADVAQFKWSSTD